MVMFALVYMLCFSVGNECSNSGVQVIAKFNTLQQCELAKHELLVSKQVLLVYDKCFPVIR